jgi:nifR3 family TIM-barrel protein
LQTGNARIMKIGNIDLGLQPLFLAPMDEITDPSFRCMCKHFGADMMYTEFVTSDGLIRNVPSVIEKMRLLPHEHPIGIQLYGHLTDAMTEAARIAASMNPDVIDINFGCPMKKIAARGAGAGMLRDVPKMVEMTAGIVCAVASIPVTVKTRLGWDDTSKNIVDVALRLQDTGIKAITIHGRTRMQVYKGDADWTLIGEVKNHPQMRIPVIGNGDIDSPQRAKEMFERYGVDGIMIGRATIGCPWIFEHIKRYLQTGECLPSPTVNERVQIARLHFDQSLQYKPEICAILEMRRHFNHYFRGLDNFKPIRLRLLTSTDVYEIREILALIEKQWGNSNLSSV